ncbi:MAG: hypothetical protein ACM3SQ_17565 [Betaproteobacteria bacterium]
MRHTSAIVLLSAALSAYGCGGRTPDGSAAPPADTAAAASSTTPSAAPGARAAKPAAERVAREIILPAGTHLPIVLDTTVGSATSRVEEPVRAHLADAVSYEGEVVLPRGSVVSGVVTSALRSGKVKGRAHIAVRFDAVTPPGGASYTIDTAAVGRTAPATTKKDALEIGAPAVGGAIVGGLLGGKKGALIGTMAGGGGGTAVVLSTRGREVTLLRGAQLTLALRAPLKVRIG